MRNDDTLGWRVGYKDQGSRSAITGSPPQPCISNLGADGLTTVGGLRELGRVRVLLVVGQGCGGGRVAADKETLRHPSLDRALYTSGVVQRLSLERFGSDARDRQGGNSDGRGDLKELHRAESMWW